MRLGKITLCFRASLLTGKKELRTWSNRTELSLREKQYQLPYSWPWTAIALLTSFQNIIKETYREKQSFNLCPRTGSVYNVPKWERQLEPCPVVALRYLPALCGHFDPMWSTKRNFVNCLSWSYLVTGLGTQGVSPNSLLLTRVPHIINSIYFPKDGFPYLPHSFMLWKPAMMANRRMNATKLPTETAELRAIVNTKQRNTRWFRTRETRCLRWKRDCLDSYSYQHKKDSTQACSKCGVWFTSSLFLPFALYSGPTTCFSSSRVLPSDLISLDLCCNKISAGSHVIPSQHLCAAFTESSEQRFYSSHLETTHHQSPERWEREMDPRGFCDFLRLLWRWITHWGHTLLWPMQWFHLLLEGERRANTQSTDQILRLQRTSGCFLEILNSGQNTSTETGRAKSERKNKGKKEHTAKWWLQSDQWEL